MFNSLTPMYADDYSYTGIFGGNGQRVKSVLDIFKSQYTHYFIGNGRTVTHFLAQLFLLIGKPYFSLINTISFLSLGIIIYYHAKLSLRNLKPFPLAFIYFSLFVFTPGFGQSYLWITGAANYLYGPMITLLFLIPFRKSFGETKNRNLGINVLYTFGMFVLGLFAGNANENNGVVVVLVSLCFIAFSIITKKHIKAWSITALIGSLLGCINCDKV